MIILKNTKNTQTFYVSKKCGIESGQLPVGSYTKIEADARFQPKGNYISEDKAVEIIDEQINSQLDVILEPKLEPIKNDITELETSKMEVFQANQPLSLHRNGEGLQLSVDLSNYATKAEIPDTSDFATKEELTAVENKIPDVSGLATKDQVALKADKSELSNYVTTDAYNTKMTELDGEISAIQAQIGNISTTLDTINGEIPNE
jgi:prefoldin subunit 5